MAIGWKLVLVVLAAFAFMAMIIVGSRRNHPLAAPLTATPTEVASVPSFDHVYVIVFENKGPSSIVGNANAAYLNQLIEQNGLATNYTAVGHPSQPNYIALWSGSAQGVRDDRVHRIAGRHLGDQLEENGKSWMIYAENVPVADNNGNSTCYTGATASGGPDGSGDYARKHDPAISFLNVSTNAARCINHISNFSHFDPAAANVELIVPNMCHTMHDCSVKVGDDWLKSWLPSHILNTPTWKKSNSAIFITFDEGDDNAGGGGHIATIVISKHTPAGFTSNIPHDHYSLLRTIESAFRLPCLQNSCKANTLGEFFQAGS